MNALIHRLTAFLSLSVLAVTALPGCTAVDIFDSVSISLTPTVSPVESPPPAKACPATEPVWLKPPADAAVQNPPEFGYYFVNEDRSMWASAWWAGQEEYHVRTSEEGIKVGWFRPAGATLEITGQRLDAQAPPLKAQVPCCYPTRFQATGLVFPTRGCWEVTARAADSHLSFVVWVGP